MWKPKPVIIMAYHAVVASACGRLGCNTIGSVIGAVVIMKEDYYCYHAGTKFDADGNIVTNGGRVLGITATGATLKEARAKAYEATEWVQFDNKYMRHDIGKAIDEA